MAPGLDPPSWLAAWPRASIPAACSARAVWQPQAPSVVWPAAGGSVWRRGGMVRAPPLIGGSARGARGAGGRRVALPRSVSPPPPGRAPRRAALSSPCPPHCSGSCPRAAVQVWLRGSPCAPAQGCWPAAGTAGVGGRVTWGMRHTAARTAAVTPLPGCSSPLLGAHSPRARRGGCRAAVSLAGLRLAVGSGGRGGRGRGGGGAHLCPPLSPGAALWWLRGGWPGGVGSGGGRNPLLLPSTLRALGCCAEPHPRAHRSPRCCRLAAWYRRGGGGRRVLGVAVWVSS